MSTRGTLYRCHLFSFGGPQTEGVESRWTRHLVPLETPEVVAGEPVGLYVRAERELVPEGFGADLGIRFDILEEDFVLTGGADDAVLSISSPTAGPPSDGFPVAHRLVEIWETEDEDSFEALAEVFRRDHPSDYWDYILVLQQRGEHPICHIVTWWRAEEVRDLLGNGELYFVANVSALGSGTTEAFDDRSESTIQVRPVPPLGDDDPAPHVGAVPEILSDEALPIGTVAELDTPTPDSTEVQEVVGRLRTTRLFAPPKTARIPASATPDTALTEVSRAEDDATSEARPRHEWYWSVRPDRPVEDDRILEGTGPLHGFYVATAPNFRRVTVRTPRYVHAYDFNRALAWARLAFGRHAYVVVEEDPTMKKPGYLAFRVDRQFKMADLRDAQPYLYHRGIPQYLANLRWVEEWFTPRSTGQRFALRAIGTADGEWVLVGRFVKDGLDRVRPNHPVLAEWEMQRRDARTPSASIPRAQARQALFGEIDALLAAAAGTEGSDFDRAVALLSDLGADAFQLVDATKRSAYLLVLLRPWLVLQAQDETVVEILKAVASLDELRTLVAELDRVDALSSLLDLDKVWSLFVTAGKRFGGDTTLHLTDVLWDIFVTEVFTAKNGWLHGTPSIDAVQVRVDPQTGELAFDLTGLAEIEQAARSFLRMLEGGWDGIVMIFTKPDKVVEALGQLVKLWWNVERARWGNPEAQAYVAKITGAMAQSIVHGFQGMLLFEELAGHHVVWSQIKSRVKWAILWEVLTFFVGIGEVAAVVKGVGLSLRVRVFARLARFFKGPLKFAKLDRLALLVSRLGGPEHADLLRYLSYLPEDDLRRIETALDSVPDADLDGPLRLQSLDDLVARHPIVGSALDASRPRIDRMARLEERLRRHSGVPDAELSDTALDGLEKLATHPQVNASHQRVLHHEFVADSGPGRSQLLANPLDTLVDSIPDAEVESFLRTVVKLDDWAQLDGRSLEFLTELASRPRVAKFVREQGRQPDFFLRVMAASGDDLRVFDRNLDAMEALLRRVGDKGGASAADDLLAALGRGDASAWDQMVDARYITDALRPVDHLTDFDRAYISEAFFDLLDATAGNAAGARQVLRQRLVNRGVAAASADDLLVQGDLFRLTKNLDLDNHVTGWTPEMQALVNAMDADAWMSIASSKNRTNAQRYRDAVQANNTDLANTYINTAKGVVGEEIFIASGQFKQALSDVRLLAAAKGLPPDRVKFMRHAGTREATSGAPSGSTKEYTDGIFAYIDDSNPPELHILGILEAKSPSNVGDLVPTTDFSKFGQLQQAFTRAQSDGFVVVGGRTFPNDRVHIGQSTVYVGVQPDITLRAGGTRTGGGNLGQTRIDRAAGQADLVENIRETLPNFRLFTNELPDEFIYDITERILDLL